MQGRPIQNIQINKQINKIIHQNLQGKQQSPIPNKTSSQICVKEVKIQQNQSKAKIIKKRISSILHHNNIPKQITSSHVINVLKMFGLNQRTMKDPSHEQSFFRTIFYIKTVQKVQLRKHALIFFIKDIENPILPMSYLIERYRSFGDRNFYQLADTLEKAYNAFTRIDFKSELSKFSLNEPLSQFIQSMKNKMYICRVAPNRLMISTKLLQFLEEDPELYGIKVCKYKTPLHEIISSQKYTLIMQKCFENLTLICSFLEKELTFEQFQSKTSLQFDDYLYAKKKKLFCRFQFIFPNPLISCLYVAKELGQAIETRLSTNFIEKQQKYFQQQITKHKFLENQTLKHLVKLPNNQIANHIMQTAGYRNIRQNN